jgi:hypothetical protein
MSKQQRYYPPREAEQIQWLQNFGTKVPGKAADLKVTTPAAADIAADARWLVYILVSWLPAVRTWRQACTQAVEQAENGTGGTLALPVFEAPPLTPADPDNNLPAVVPRAEGALQRIFAFVQSVKGNASNAVAEDLGLRGAPEPQTDLSTVQPEFTAEVRADGVFLGWGFGGHGKVLDAWEAEVDRGSGYVPLTFDTSPGYLDTAPQPAQRTRWKYRAWFRVDDHRVGLLSNVVMVDVGGN